MPARTSATTRRRTTRRSPGARRRRPNRHARRRGRKTGVALAIAVPAILFGAFLVGAALLAGSFRMSWADDLALAPDDRAPAPPPIIEPAVAGYRFEQLTNACTILAAGRDLGFDARDQTIAVMTAMGESSLRNIDYGDWETSGVTNPDGSRTTSIGLFQQQDSWGTRDARLDPYTAATVFYRAMAERVPDRAAVEPTLVAHRTQVNADPYHYARYWDRAVRVVAAVTGSPMEGDRIDGIPHCPRA
ncbi:peptidase M23 [Microbacterium trichothecenolyticum]|uniref:peptidase M23 n=1 Tax=Microbacterium trichothecenolyticum TaxID=69370 RepID=UPI001C6E1FFD|nr:peptidase M23 [Microbacterium trichothecenolyticum]MBW9118921.1 peptidase M23 [Microbacterium trichothecenolyticum]